MCAIRTAAWRSVLCRPISATIPSPTLSRPLLEHLAKSPGLSLHAYYNYALEDHVTLRLRRYFAHWNSVTNLSDAALARKIEDDGIDILIDLSGHTSGNRLLTFARKPAPIQASWLGYPGTTGLTAMDYFLADRHFLPTPEFSGQFVEKLAHVPAGSTFEWDRSAPNVNALPALTNGFVTFGSFNRLSKLRSPVIALWARLLRQIPTARMLLAGLPPDGQYDELISWFCRRRHPAGASRLSCALRNAHLHGAPPPGGHLSRRISVHRGGPRPRTRCGWAFPPSRSPGAPRPAGKVPAYSVTLICRRSWLTMPPISNERASSGRAIFRLSRTFASTLRDRCAKSVVARPDLVAQGMELALRAMWQRWCGGLPAESFEVSLPATFGAVQSQS